MFKALFIFSFIVLSFVSEAKIIDKIVAIVNDRVITKSDIETLRSNLKKGGLLVDEVLISLYSPKDILSKDSVALDYLINERLTEIEVEKHSLQVPIEKVEEEIRNLNKSRGRSRSQLISSLKSKGIQFEDYFSFLQSFLERQSLLRREVASKVKISQDDLIALYLKKNQSNNKLFYRYTVSHILFLKKNGGSAKALERADQVYQNLKSGKNFEDLAKQNSEDPNFADNGLLGELESGGMLPSFEKGLKNLKSGDFSKPVASPAGYHILKLLDKKLIPDPKFNEQKQQLTYELSKSLYMKQLKRWLTQKRQQSYIRIN